LAKRGLKVSDIGAQIVGTATEDEIISNFIHDVTKRYGFIDSALGFDATALLAFYPHGKTEYDLLTKGTVHDVMIRFRDACVAHTGALGAAFVMIFTNYESNYVTAHATHGTNMAATGMDSLAIDTTRTDLEICEMLNKNTISDTFPGDVATCHGYCKFPLLYAHGGHSHLRFSGTLDAGLIFDILNRNWNDDAIRVRLYNLSGDDMEVAIINSPTGVIGTKVGKVKAGNTHAFKPIDIMNNPLFTQLVIKNLSPSTSGLWEVEIFWVN
jgi:hypothetical protein